MNHPDLDAHVVATVRHHFSPETGTPFWLDWAARAGWDPRAEVRGADDLLRFEPFDDELLRATDLRDWIPRAAGGAPPFAFETGGTTGAPKHRPSWADHERDYEAFSAHLPDDAFPPGADWLMLGPTGPRRLRLAIEHLARYRGGTCFFVDLDPRWVKRLLRAGDTDQARAYTEHVLDQAEALLHQRRPTCLFATPRLLEGLGDRVDLAAAGIKGVFCGGTSMTPQVIRFCVEEVLGGAALLVPTYGNTLMGLARSRPLRPEDGYALTYHAPQPRALLRVVDPDDPDSVVPYGAWGRVELTTLTEEFFLPRLLERDEAQRRPPRDGDAAAGLWGDGVGGVRPFRAATADAVVEGVY